MNKSAVFLMMGCCSGCLKESPPPPKAENVATRYVAGLVTATEKAKISVDKANRAIAASQAVSDAMTQEVQ